MRLIGQVALAVTWLLVVRVIAAGWRAQRAQDRLDARARHRARMEALGRARRSG